MHKEDAHPVSSIHWFALFPQFLKSVLKVRKILHEWGAGIFPSKDLSTSSFPELRGTFPFCPFLFYLKKDKKKKSAAINGIKKPTHPAANFTSKSCYFTPAHATVSKPLSHFPGCLCIAHLCVVFQVMPVESSCSQACI